LVAVLAAVVSARPERVVPLGRALTSLAVRVTAPLPFGVLVLTLWTLLLALARAVLVGVSSWAVVIVLAAMLAAVIVLLAMSVPRIPLEGLVYLAVTALMIDWVLLSRSLAGMPAEGLVYLALRSVAVAAPAVVRALGSRLPSGLWATSRKLLRMSPQVLSSEPGLGRRVMGGFS
jgi:hypothetical protein